MYRRSAEHEEKAERNAETVMAHWGIPEEQWMAPRICVVLGGAGWGDVSIMQPEHHQFLVPDNNYWRRPILNDFSGLQELPEHKRVVEYGHVAGKEVLVLKGRVHLNEGVKNPAYKFYARLQIEILIKMGCRVFVLTSAAASFREEVRVGDVIVVNGFDDVSAPEMPLEAFEKPQAERVLCPNLRLSASRANTAASPGFKMYETGVAMVRGPLVPVLSCNKPHLRMSGASATVTSILPEATIAALYPDMRVLGLAFVSIGTDGTIIVPTDEQTAKRGELLTRIIEQLP